MLIICGTFKDTNCASISYREQVTYF